MSDVALFAALMALLSVSAIVSLATGAQLLSAEWLLALMVYAAICIHD